MSGLVFLLFTSPEGIKLTAINTFPLLPEEV